MAWKWNPPADATLGGLLNGPMAALTNYLGLAEKVKPVQAVVRTTGATVTTLYTAAITVNKTLLVSGSVVARRTGGASGATNDGAGYTVLFVAKNTAGTAALIGSGTVVTVGESVAGWDVTLSASGGDILVRVTGAATTNITWNWTGTTFTGKE